MRHARVSWTLLLAGALVATTSLPAAAEELTISVSGLNLMFDNGTIEDNGAALGSITFQKPSSKYSYTLSGSDLDLHADVHIQGVADIPENGWVEPSGEGSYFTLSSSTDTLLSMPLGNLFVSYANELGTKSVEIDGNATGTITQHLPDGLVIGGDITIMLLIDTLVGPAPGVDGEPLVGFGSSGSTGQIAGTAVPEPGSLMILLGLAASALAACAWRHRQS